MNDDASDVIFENRLLGDTGFKQPSSADLIDPVGDACVEEDLPELEDVETSGVEVPREKSRKDDSCPQEEKPNESKEDNGPESGIEKKMEAMQDGVESDCEMTAAPVENGSEREEKATEKCDTENENPIEVGSESKEEAVVSKEQRRALFKEAKSLEETGQLDEALEKFTAALTGVRPETAFPELPACLRALAEIYYKREQYEKAVHFVQAEKMYYEAALLDTSVLQSILRKDVKQSLMQDKDDSHLQKLRANEYETLARFCVDKTELSLALEYAAKAAKLREAVFGPDHEETIRSLDFMTAIYADLGKQEYAESLEKFERSRKGSASEVAPSSGASQTSPTVGQPQQGEHFDREVRISLLFFAIMVFIACAVLTGVSCYAYCKLTVSPLCESIASILAEQMSWLHYQLHNWLL